MVAVARYPLNAAAACCALFAAEAAAEPSQSPRDHTTSNRLVLDSHLAEQIFIYHRNSEAYFTLVVSSILVTCTGHTNGYVIDLSSKRAHDLDQISLSLTQDSVLRQNAGGHMSLFPRLF